MNHDIHMGDIGTEQEETEILPLHQPIQVPDVPPVPSEPVPA